MSGTIDVALAISRDTVVWEELNEAAPFLPLGPNGAFDLGMILVGAMGEFRDRLYFFYSGWNAEHGVFVGEPEVEARAQVGLATLRLDGFATLEPADDRGPLVTTPFQLSDDRLEISADASSGSVVIEVVDPEGTALPGFGADSATPIRGDGVRLSSGWQNADLSTLRGTTVRLRFTLAGGAHLYAFQVVSRT